MTKTFERPFCEIGDKTSVPDDSQPSGSVSYEEGYPSDYELDQTGGPPAKDVERQEMNQLFFDITELLQEIQQNGLPVYNATYDYAVGGYTIASDGVIYRALIANGPASSVVDPVGDATGTWLSNRGDLRNYSATFDYVPDDIVKGSDGILYVALLDNGPINTPVTDPVSDTTGRWVALKSDVSSYLATFDYAINDYAKGADGVLYLATVPNGPATSVVNPVGDNTSTWLVVGGSLNSVVITVFTASGNFSPNSRTKSLRVTVTGAGGGGGACVDGIGGQAASAVSGGGGGTAIAAFFAADTTYTVVVGAGGAGGAARGENPGSTGGTSSFDGTAITIIQGLGGEGGEGAALGGDHVIRPGALGGVPTGGDINVIGGRSNASVVAEGFSSTGVVGSVSTAGVSYWGGGGDNGSDGLAYGSGGGGSEQENAGNGPAGGDGAPGVVVVEEFF